MKTAPRPERVVAPDQMARLTDWNARKPVIAIMGEFSAGKSTLLNMLIGQTILPTQVTATKLPPVWLRHGTDAPFRVDKFNRRHAIDLNDLSSVPVKDTRFIRIYCEAEVLESCDLLDTPGISDPNIPMGWWIKSLGFAHSVLWCSHAGQAWRESERSAWESLPERLRRHSLLLVTRSDKITSEIDRMKIDTRLRRETENLFGGRLFISLTNALRALEGEGDAELWAASGAENFVEMLANEIAALNNDRTLALNRYQVDPSYLARVTPRRVRPGSGNDDAAADSGIAVQISSGADILTLRPIRVVAVNESPIEPVSAAQRPTLHQVPASDEEQAELTRVLPKATAPDILILDEETHSDALRSVDVNVWDTEINVSSTEPLVDSITHPMQDVAAGLLPDQANDSDADADSMVALGQIAASDTVMLQDVPVEISPASAVDDEAADRVADKTGALEALSDVVAEAIPDAVTDVLTDTADLVDLKIDPEPVPDRQLDYPDAVTNESFAIAGLAFEEVLHEDLLSDDNDSDRLMILAKLSRDVAADLGPNPFDALPPAEQDAAEAEAEAKTNTPQTAVDDPTEADESYPISHAAVGGDAGDVDVVELAANNDDSGPPAALDQVERGMVALWQDTLTGQKVESVQDILALMTAFLSRMDQEGRRINRPDTAEYTEFLRQQHRRRTRAVRRGHV